MSTKDLSAEKRLAGTKVVIIGGSSGFGLEVARQAAQAGASLVLAGRDGQKAEAVAKDLAEQGIDAAGYGIDATKQEQLNAFLQSIGTFDHFMSTVGGAMGGGFLEAPAEEIRRAIEEKFYANLFIARAVAPHINKGGSMTFTAGSGGRPDNASGAIIGNEAISTLVRGLAVELAPNARVNAVAPTWTVTPLWRNLEQQQIEEIRAQFGGQIPLGRTAEIGEVAQAYVFLMTCGFITGQTITVDGGLTLVT